MGFIKGSFLPGASQKVESRRESCREGGLAGVQERTRGWQGQHNKSVSRGEASVSRE